MNEGSVALASTVSPRPGRALLVTIVARGATLPISLACALVTVRLLVGSEGVADYGMISLLVTLQALLPFMDLGTGAGVLDAAAHFRATGDRSLFNRRWSGATRI